MRGPLLATSGLLAASAALGFSPSNFRDFGRAAQRRTHQTHRAGASNSPPDAADGCPRKGSGPSSIPARNLKRHRPGRADEGSTRREFLRSPSYAASLASILASTGMDADAAMAAVDPGPTADSVVSAVPPFPTRREYKHVILANGLRVLLVQDKGPFPSCAALSVGASGQFFDDPDLPGSAHLMEHLILSGRPSIGSKGAWKEDFEDWLEDYDGSSNGFTAAGKALYHFSCPADFFPEALGRFAQLFDEDVVTETCRNEAVLRREVRRIDSELTLDNDATRAFYLLKSRANPDHPFSRFGAGSLESLEQTPRANGVDVSRCMDEFFRRNYVPEKAVLVVVSPDNVRTLQRLVAPFSNKLSTRKETIEGGTAFKDVSRYQLPYPPPFPKSTFSQTILVKANGDEESCDTLKLEWPLDLIYSTPNFKESTLGSSNVITAPAIGFVISQILGRKGPESLRAFLLRRKWAQKGVSGMPRISFPVDVTGFQVMSMEIALTSEGFANRSAVIAALLSCIKSISRIAPKTDPFLLPREQISQYLTIAAIHGYTLAPRPPDAIELAVDAQTFGMDGQSGIGVMGAWSLMPSTNDAAGVEAMRRAVASTLEIMANPSKTIATVIARPQSISSFIGGIVDPALPSLNSTYWSREPRTGAQYFVESVGNLDRLLVAPMLWALSKVEGDVLGPPVLNPFVPPSLRPARPVLERRSFDGSARFYYVDNVANDDSKGIWREFVRQPVFLGAKQAQTSWQDRSVTTVVGGSWKLFQTPPIGGGGLGLPMPMVAPEPSCRCSLVIQLLSTRAMLDATAREMARAQLWLLSFDEDIVDLAELGAPAGLAYDLSFNQYGLRICFRGISQTLPSYARQLCKRLVQHHARLVDGSVGIAPGTKIIALQQASALNLPSARKRQLISDLRASTASDAASEGSSFLNSCAGGAAFAQGDILPYEAVKLCNELQSVFSRVVTNRYSVPEQPDIRELLYKPVWKPKTSSPLLIPGVALINDACGRVKR